MPDLDWLPEPIDWRARLAALKLSPDTAWRDAMVLANTRLDFVQTTALDQTLRRVLAGRPGGDGAPVRLALLGSCTMAHLHAAIRVAGLRRGIAIEIYEAEFGQYWHELADPGSALHAFRPTELLLALDAYHLAAGVSAGAVAEEVETAMNEAQARIRACWRLALDTLGCPVIHQTPLPVHPELLGSNEHRLPGAPAGFITRLAAALRPMADAAGVDLLALDARAARDGIAAWHDPALWHRAKQDISPLAAPMFGDLLVRLIAARRGLSRKCLVLDLDNTLWGGVVGDDGLDGLVLGQGSALGEAFVDFQRFARDLSRRGVILAVCSKNDLANAEEPFAKHPEMVLKRDDIACFVANWSDKAANLRSIAAALNIGIDSLVFVDDNPFERNLVRQELPMVAVPEVGDDPTYYARIIADAGYFESLAITAEDRARAGQYQGNRRRETLKATATDLSAYLRGLEMQLVWRRFDQIGLARTTQLINKTNQFNLTTRRYTEREVREVMADPRAFGLQLRLLDRFGDNGIIAIVIGRMVDDDLLIDTWLMSCRVLGRQMEPTTLNLVAAQAQALGAHRLLGDYVPTAKNAMVRDHYTKLGFTVAGTDPSGHSRATLDLADFTPAATFIDVRQG